MTRLPSRDPEPPVRFGCEVEPDRDLARVRLVGELDMATVGVLDAHVRELRDAGFKRLILDLRRLEFMDAMGLGLLLALDADARQDGFSVAFVPGAPSVQHLFEVTCTAGRLSFIEIREA